VLISKRNAIQGIYGAKSIETLLPQVQTKYLQR
jgi:hypothetical protein